MMAKQASNSNRGSKPGEHRGGRKKGTPNKLTGTVKEMILKALNDAHKDGGSAYLTQQAKDNPASFMTLLGKVIPLQLSNDPDNPLPPAISVDVSNLTPDQLKALASVRLPTDR